MNAKDLAESAITAVKGFVTAQLTPVLKRLDSLEARQLEKGADGKDGTNGKDGTDGKDGDGGRDALMLDVLPGIDETRAYPPRTYASHEGGVWVSRRKTKGMDGWECIVEGLREFHVEQSAERIFTVSATMSSGKVIPKAFTLPVLLYRGIWRDTETYQPGDTATWAGSCWHCNAKDCRDKPGNGETWKLIVKKGNDGKGT